MPHRSSTLCTTDTTTTDDIGFAAASKVTTPTTENDDDDENCRDFSDDEDQQQHQHDEDDKAEDDADDDDDTDDDAAAAESMYWKTAVDPKSGRTYWYNAVTRETQWRPPLCCATPAERRAAAQRDAQTRDFFASMEANILKSMAMNNRTNQNNNNNTATTTIIGSASKNNNTPPPNTNTNNTTTSPYATGGDTGVSSVATPSLHQNIPIPLSRSMIPLRQAAPQMRPSLLVRTISSMESSVLADLIRRVPSFRTLSVDEDDLDIDMDEREDRILLAPTLATSAARSTSLRGVSLLPPLTLLSPIREGGGGGLFASSPGETMISPNSHDSSSSHSTTPENNTPSIKRAALSSLSSPPLCQHQQQPAAAADLRLGVEREESIQLESLLGAEQSTSSRAFAAFTNSTVDDDEKDGYFKTTNNDNTNDSLHRNSQQSRNSFSSSRPSVNNNDYNVNSARFIQNSMEEHLNVDDYDDDDDDNDDDEVVVRMLPRLTGSLNLTRNLTDSNKATADKHSIPSKCLRNSVVREESLNLASLSEEQTDNDSSTMTRLQADDDHDTSFMAWDTGKEADWGSFWSQAAEKSARGGLSAHEGQSMRDLVAIAKEMANVEMSSSSSSSSNSSNCSLDGLDALPSDDTEENQNVNNLPHGSRNTSCDSLNYSKGSLRASGNMSILLSSSTAAGTPKNSIPVGRPIISRPMSLRQSLSQPSQPAATGATSSSSSTMEKPGMIRRNTCGTLYVGSTMSAPDKDATIKCVCAVYRAHILQSFLDRHADGGAIDETGEFRVFNDVTKLSTGRQGSLTKTRKEPTPPTLEEITFFYRDVFSRAQMESDCIIISLIYIERLIKVTEGALRPQSINWRSILFSCMVMASKVWDDLSMWNADFSQTCPSGVQFTLQRVNELELAVLSALQYKVKVPASEYAKYYFLLRSMLIKSGLGSEDLATMNPLDVEGAKQLQHVSAQYQVSVSSMSSSQRAGRSKSAGTTDTAASDSLSPLSGNNGAGHQNGGGGGNNRSGKRNPKVGLEHLVEL